MNKPSPPPSPPSPPSPQERREMSRDIRIAAAKLAYNRPLPTHQANGDEAFPFRMLSFTKGLPHSIETGLLKNEGDFDLFVEGICSGDPDIIKRTPLGPNKDYLRKMNEVEQLACWQSGKGRLVNSVRAWESSSAGLTFDLQGPDAQAVTMKAAPALASTELVAELAEVYAQAVLRDEELSKLETSTEVLKWFKILSRLTYFSDSERQNFGNTSIDLTLKNLFRGLTLGDVTGPYLSQFLLAGNNGLNKKAIAGEVQNQEFKASDGFINYGSIVIDQKVRAAETVDYMTTWDEYIDVQNGADFRALERYEKEGNKRKFITTGRDLATYVHYDALYEAYLNACLLLLGAGASFDKGVPFQDADIRDKQQGFAHYGGPHILSLVTEVATRALKAVRFQKFNVHRRLRPEVLAARMEKKQEILDFLRKRKDYYDWDAEPLERFHESLATAGVFDALYGNKLLPMAFCEGSPMHPSYGAGHATVAGACVTILKAFFNHNLYVNVAEDGATINFTKTPPENSWAFIPTSDGQALKTIQSEVMTLEGELNKLAANISIGRNWAGVHFYSDYRESLLLGEEIAIGILEEQALTYNPKENFFLTLPKFNGRIVRIDKDGIHENPA